MTRNADKVWEDIKNSHLNIGITTTPARLNYWDGRDLFEGEDVPADLREAVNAATRSTRLDDDGNTATVLTLARKHDTNDNKQISCLRKLIRATRAQLTRRR